MRIVYLAGVEGCLVPAQQIEGQGIGEDRGFRLLSRAPVLAYQWNPYGPGLANADTSLLIPVTSLGEDYIAATWNVGPNPDVYPIYQSKVTVVATEEEHFFSLTAWGPKTYWPEPFIE